MSQKGTLSIHSENIFPIIKKWLYSDHDIFIRELISNGCDAILKFKKLCSMGETTCPADEKYKINVTLDEKARTITISDNGLGMTKEEIEKYINQIAFSGAEDFLEKYQDKMDQEQIIGHFGLGFYSSFMVANTVEINTLSYQDGAEPAKWSCDGGTDYEITDGTRTERGTDIILHISEDGETFLKEHELRGIIEKYCSFMPIPIFLDVVKEKEEKTIASDIPADVAEDKATDIDGLDVESITGEDTEELDALDEEPEPLNDINPLYTRKPSECTDEEYKDFYKKTFMDFNEPLFWIHLNMDYPFRLKGILYFPKLKHELETIEGTIKLYNNQVFVAENIKEVIPEFLLLLKGVIDCPDLPLNVSRSLLQNDGFVRKISDYITRKVADRLTSLYKKDNDNYVKFWDDISPFVKYGCIREPKFFDKMKDSVIYKTTSDDYISLDQYLERNKEKHENKVFYVSDALQQAQYIKLLKDNELEAILLTHSIDNAFMSHVEMRNQGVKFTRVDSDLSDALKGEEVDKDIQEKLSALFKEILGNEKLDVQVENLKTASISGMILLSEENRRMQEMMKMYGMDLGGAAPAAEEKLILNQNNPLIQLLSSKIEDKEISKLLCEQVYDLALLSHKPLEADAMTAFIERSNKVLEILAQK
ncbi:MAG TPA: molecular chaperone HtpG [Epulopiscium sp.]|nr:molecular chaperone HtpG [Candidatus Epulonipiscium sp.]